MDNPLFHPKLVHVPMALAVLMPIITGALLLAWWRGWLAGRSWFVAVALQAVLFASGVMAVQSGEAEEERVERVVPEAAIEAHEHAAEAFVWASASVLTLMLLAGIFVERRYGRAIALASALGSWVVLGLGYRTGQAGGRLVYEYGAARAYLPQGSEGRMAGEPPPTLGQQPDGDD